MNTNRHAVIGEFETFAPIKRSLDQIVKDAVALKRGEATSIPPRPPREIMRVASYSLVRYFLSSEEMRNAIEMAGLSHFVDADRAKISAFFGIVNQDGVPELFLDAIQDRSDGGPQISFVLLAKHMTVTSDIVAQFLNHLDIPPSWRAGADAILAEHFDAYWDRQDGGWQLLPPRYLIKVAFERLCFATRPLLSETTDVFVAFDPKHDLNDADPDRAYAATVHYREAGWGELHRLEPAQRPGFSSWLEASKPPELVKVINNALDADIARVQEWAEDCLSNDNLVGSHNP